MGHKGPAAIGNGVVLPIFLLLWQHCPQSILGHISLQQEGFSVVNKSQTGGCHTCLFQHSKSPQGIFCKWHLLWLPAGPFPSQIFAEWLCNACEPFDELPVVAHQTEKGTHLCVSLRQHALCNCFQAQVTGWHPILWDSMHQIGDFFSEKAAFQQLQFQIMLSKLVKDDA